MGVRLSIDDFGTGYSSLTYLTRFHVNTLKIDGSFVQGIATHPGNVAVIKTILALGKAMSLDVIAEGVETPDQARFLKRHHCHLLQRYLLSLPVAAHEILGILTKTFATARRFYPKHKTLKKYNFIKCGSDTKTLILWSFWLNYESKPGLICSMRRPVEIIDGSPKNDLEEWPRFEKGRISRSKKGTE